MRNRALPADTTLEAMRAQMAIWQRMGPEGRQRRVVQLTNTARRLARDGIRQRHPEYTEDEVRLTEIRLRLGDELFRKVYPAAPFLPA
jgi:hypothetical protein